MKNRRAIVVIGIIAVGLVLAVVGLAVYFLSKLEKEYNVLKTKPARDGKQQQRSGAPNGFADDAKIVTDEQQPGGKQPEEPERAQESNSGS